MSKYARMAALAASTATLLITPSADAVCIQHSSSTVTLVTVPTPYGPLEVKVPLQTEVDPAHCSATVFQVVQTVTQLVP